MRKSDNRLKLNNTGAALVTVIVVIAFVSVMVTVLLYSAGINFYMKTTDMKIKNNFYSTETALEQIRSALVDVAGDAYEQTYKDALVNFEFNATAGVGNSSFNSDFVGNFKTLWTNKLGSNTMEGYLKLIVDSVYSSGLSCSSTELELHETEGYVVLKGVKICFVKDGYESVIETDYIIKAPEIDMDLYTSATNWDPADTDHDKAKTRKELDLVTCVNYYNWVKK
ncbi:MAG: hypothetical protein ACI4TL_00830 [Candidatus Cryptobacteroides sp.]